jgi:hypothetical protein
MGGGRPRNKSTEQGWLSGDVVRWTALRNRIHEQICSEGFDANLNPFVHFYGSKHLMPAY